MSERNEREPEGEPLRSNQISLADGGRFVPTPSLCTGRRNAREETLLLQGRGDAELTAARVRRLLITGGGVSFWFHLFHIHEHYS